VTKLHLKIEVIRLLFFYSNVGFEKILTMPYQNIKDLPESVKNHLPKHAQEIFLATFNHAIEEYDSEESAFRVAWSAVKRDDEKGQDDNWHEKKAE
jgi:cation transport regulator